MTRDTRKRRRGTLYLGISDKCNASILYTTKGDRHAAAVVLPEGVVDAVSSYQTFKDGSPSWEKDNMSKIILEDQREALCLYNPCADGIRISVRISNIGVFTAILSPHCSALPLHFHQTPLCLLLRSSLRGGKGRFRLYSLVLTCIPPEVRRFGFFDLSLRLCISVVAIRKLCSLPYRPLPLPSPEETFP